MSALLREAPKALGAGEDVPAGVGLEWARWGRDPEYLGAFASAHGGRGFAHWQGELCALASPTTASRRAPPSKRW